MEIPTRSATGIKLERELTASYPPQKSEGSPESHWFQVMAKANVFRGMDVHLIVADRNQFEIKEDSGFFGALGYSRMSMKPSTFIFRQVPMLPSNAHKVILQISGSGTVTTDKSTFSMRSGDILLINRNSIRWVEHHEHSDVIALDSPLPDNTLNLLRNEPYPIRHSSSELTKLATRFCKDLIPNPAWLHSGHREDMGAIINNLFAHAFLELPTSTAGELKNKVSRNEIETHVLSRLEDSSMSVPSIAKSLGCSARTLHRCFHQDGNVSLEAYICKARIDACSVLLRQEDTQKIQLTELALRFGFANSSHFSSAFRRLMGLSPSQYRRLSR